MRKPFIYEEIEHWTGADLMGTLQLIGSQEEADAFLVAYVEANNDDEEHANSNLRYMLQIIATDDDNENAEEEAEQLAEWFGLDMPAPDEAISPRQWWLDSSLGVKEAA